MRLRIRCTGFIARGIGTDGVCHYPLSSDDQAHPWFYGLHAYFKSDLPTIEERQKIVAKVKEVAEALEATGWRVPCDGAFKGDFRGGFQGHLFRDAARYLFMLRATHEITGDHTWLDRYHKALSERPAQASKTRVEICAEGYPFDREAIARIDEYQLWIYVGSQASLAKLITMETDETILASYRAGLVVNARNALLAIKAHESFDNNDTKVFGSADWRAVYSTWFPQPTQADAKKLSEIADNTKLGERKGYESRFMRNPLAGAAIVALLGDGTEREAIERAIRHYDYSKLNMALFFFAECAFYALPAGKSGGRGSVEQPEEVSLLLSLPARDRPNDQERFLPASDVRGQRCLWRFIGVILPTSVKPDQRPALAGRVVPQGAAECGIERFQGIEQAAESDLAIHRNGDLAGHPREIAQVIRQDNPDHLTHGRVCTSTDKTAGRLWTMAVQ